jgi:hypothetical protein
LLRFLENNTNLPSALSPAEAAQESIAKNSASDAPPDAILTSSEERALEPGDVVQGAANGSEAARFARRTVER